MTRKGLGKDKEYARRMVRLRCVNTLFYAVMVVLLHFSCGSSG